MVSLSPEAAKPFSSNDIKKLETVGQSHLIAAIEAMSPQERTEFAKQINGGLAERISKAKRLSEEAKSNNKHATAEPPSESNVYRDASKSEPVGRKAVKDGKVAVFLLAGETYEGKVSALEPVKGGKSLLETKVERAKAENPNTPVFVVTTHATEEAVKRAVADSPSLKQNVSGFIKQEALPASSNESGNNAVAFETKSRVKEAPSESAIVAAKAEYSKLKSAGVEYVQFVDASNAAARPADPELVGAAVERKAEAAAKAFSTSSSSSSGPSSNHFVKSSNGSVTSSSSANAKSSHGDAVNYVFSVDYAQRVADEATRDPSSYPYEYVNVSNCSPPSNTASSVLSQLSSRLGASSSGASYSASVPQRTLGHALSRAKNATVVVGGDRNKEYVPVRDSASAQEASKHASSSNN